ncbi:MAG: zinc protease [Flavobacteriales bacterium]|jgi:zinc protease
MASIEKAYNDRTKTNSENFVGEFQANFLENEPAPGIEWTFKTFKQILPLIELKDVNGLIKEYVKEDNRVIILTGPEKEGLKKVTEQEVLDAIKVNTDELKPYKDAAVATSLLRNEVKPGTIVSRESNAKLGTKSLVLFNGARVTYKNTDFKNDEVLFEAVSLGGSNLYSNEEMKKVQFANGALAEAGFSGLKLNDINKFMTGKIARVNPYISATTEGLRGSSTPKDLEYLFQMAYAYFTDLNFDQEAFEGFKQKQSSFFKNMASTPQNYFQQEFYTYLNQNNPRFFGIMPTDKSWADTDYKLAYEKYKERFANATDFEFYFV